MDSVELIRLAVGVLSDCVYKRPTPAEKIQILRDAAPELDHVHLPLDAIASEIVRRELEKKKQARAKRSAAPRDLPSSNR
jgi:hypothetical protein